MPDPRSVYLGDRHDLRPVILLGTSIRSESRVLLLAITESTESPSSDYSSDNIPPQLPLDFTEAVAIGVDRIVDGYVLSFEPSDREIDFVATDGTVLPIGTPVFVGDQFLGIAASGRSPPEKWMNWKVAEEKRRKESLGLARSLGEGATRLWSLYELAEMPQFKPYLTGAGVDDLQPSTKIEELIPESATSGPFTLFSWDWIHSSEETSRAVVENTPEGLWIPLARPPRPFPLAPKRTVALAIIVVLLAVTAALTLFGLPPSPPVAK